MRIKRIFATMLGAVAVLALAACGGGGDSSGSSGRPSGEATAYEFEISGYTPTGSTSSGLAAALSTSSPAKSLPRFDGELLPVPDGGGSAETFTFSVRVDEELAEVVELIDLPPNLPEGVYDLYAILKHEASGSVYGGVISNRIITDVSGNSENVVRFTLFPVVGVDDVTNFHVTDFRDLSASALVLPYEERDTYSTDPKLVVTIELADGTTVERIYRVNTEAALAPECGGVPCIVLYLSGTSGVPAHRFYYGDVAVIAPTDGTATNDPTPTLDYTIDDPCFEDVPDTCSVTVTVSSNGGGDTTVSTRDGDPLPALEDGTHTVTVTWTDEDGDEQSFALTFDVDATPPTVTVEDSNGSGSTGGTIQDGGTLDSDSGEVAVTSNETSTVSVYLDPDATCSDALSTGGDTSSCDSYLEGSLLVEEGQTVTASVTGLAPGEHQLYLVAVDELSNQSIEVVTFTVVDDTAPNVLISDPQNIFYDSQTVPLAYTISDDVTPASDLSVEVGVERYDPDTATWNAVGVTFGSTTTTATSDGGLLVESSINVSADGRFRVTVSATNPTPLTSAVTREFRVDTAWPAVAIIQPPHGGTVYSNRPQLEVESTEDNLFKTQIFLIEGPFDPNTTVYGEEDLLDIPIDGNLQWPNGDPLLDGEYTVIVELTDVVGHTTTAYSTFIVNAAAPSVEIVNPVEGDLITNGTVNLKYHVRDASEVEVWVETPLDPNPAEPLIVRLIDPVEPIPRTYEDKVDVPVDGEHTIRVVARDTALPVEAQDTVTFDVDGHRPSVQITDPAEGTVYTQPGVVPLTFHASDATAYEVRVGHTTVAADALDGTAVAVSLELGPFADDGVHTITVEVSDGHSSSSDSLTLVVDGTPPELTLTSPKSGQVFEDDDTVTLLYAAKDASGIISEQVWLDGVLQEGAGSGTTFSNLTARATPYTLEVQVQDAALNATTASVSFSVEPDDDGDDDNRRRGRASCIRTPIAGDDDKLDALLKCVRNKHSWEK